MTFGRCTVLILLVSSAQILPARALSQRMTCIYTEPFVTTTYDPGRRTLTIDSATEKRPETIRGVVVEPLDRGKIRFRKGSRSFQIVSLREKGSDGMSDKVFPYAGQLARGRIAGGRIAGGGIAGGCE